MRQVYTTIGNFEILWFKSKERMDQSKFHRIVRVAKGDASRK